MKEERSVQVLVRLTPAEKKILDRRAALDKHSGPDHLRACFLMDAVMSTDLDAIKLVGSRLGNLVRERMTEWSEQGIQ